MRWVASLAAVTFVLSVGPSWAVSDVVKQACSADYASLCSQHKVGTEALRTCMREHRHVLTQGCIKALGTSDEVTQQDIRDYKREHNE